MTDVMAIAERHGLADQADLYEWESADAFAVVRFLDGEVMAVFAPYPTAAAASDALLRMAQEASREGVEGVTFHLTTCDGTPGVG